MLSNNLLHIIPGRNHSMFRKMRLNPLWNWDQEKTTEWINNKKKDFVKFRGAAVEEQDDCNDDDTEVDDEYTDDN